MPFIGLKGRYNERWYLDIVSLPHNAVRKQLTNVFTVLTSMHKMALDLTEQDFQLFYWYASVQIDFFKALLDAEEEALYGHFGSVFKGRSTGVFDVAKRASTKKEIVKQFDDVLRKRHLVLPSIDTLGSLLESFDASSRLMLGYFREKEEVIPGVLEKSPRGEKDKTRYESRLIDLLLQRPRGQLLVALLAHALVNPDVRRDFVERHFEGKEQRQRFFQSVASVSRDVLPVADAFQKAAAKYERAFSMGTFMEYYGQDRDHEATTELVS